MFFIRAAYATQTPRPPRWKMMNGVRGRIEASRVGQTTWLDQPSSAGTSAALPGSGGDMNVMDPGRQKPQSSFAAAIRKASRVKGFRRNQAIRAWPLARCKRGYIDGSAPATPSGAGSATNSCFLKVRCLHCFLNRVRVHQLMGVQGVLPMLLCRVRNAKLAAKFACEAKCENDRAFRCEITNPESNKSRRRLIRGRLDCPLDSSINGSNSIG